MPSEVGDTPQVVPLAPHPTPAISTRSSRRPQTSNPAIVAIIGTAALLAVVALGAFAYRASTTTDVHTRQQVNDVGSAALGAAVLCGIGLVALVLYFVPTFIAVFRKHQNAPAIAVLNILTGWSFVGWVAALVWSFTEVRSRDHYHYHNYAPPN